MKSSIVELKLQLGESLESEVARRAQRAGITPEAWIAYFLADGRLTPKERSALVEAQA